MLRKVVSGVLAALLSATAASAAAKFPVQLTAAATSAPLGPIPNAEAWGAMARLGGTAWLDQSDGAVWEFRWQELGEAMIWTRHRVVGDLVSRAVVGAKGSVAIDGNTLTRQSSDVFSIGDAKLGWRAYFRVIGARLLLEQEELKDGEWTTTTNREFRLIPASQVASALAALAPKQEAYRAQVAAEKEAVRDEAESAAMPDNARWTKYGLFGRLVGTYWLGNSKTGEVWTWEVHRDKNNTEIMCEDVIQPEYDYSVYCTHTYLRPGITDTLFDSSFMPDKHYLMPDGSILTSGGELWELESPKILRYSRVKVKGRTYTHKTPPEIFRLTRLNAQQVAVVEQGISQRLAKLAQKAQSSGGGGGLGSIVAGAAMGAILGGGGQSSVDLAVAGAQAAARGGNTLDVLNSMGGVAAANAAESKRQLDETIARAQGGNSGGSSTGYSGSTTAVRGTASSPATSRPAMTRKTIQVYYTAGTVVRDNDDHNTHCQSNIFSVTIDWDPSLVNDGGNLGYANALLDPMKSRFAEKCSQAGRPVTALADVDWFADAFDSSGGGWGSGRQLRKGDIEVQMP
jgi:hypothetical protein